MLYVDTSFLVPLFKAERQSADVRFFLGQQAPRHATVSHWTQVEFSSFVAEDVRIGNLTAAQAIAADAGLDAFVRNTCSVIAVERRDFDLARRLLADHRSGLRAGDALHLAVASNNVAAGIYSLDRVMVAAGLSLGLPMNAGFHATI